MAKTLRLIHPIHGVCAIEVLRPNFSEERIKGIWKGKYGANMFGQCVTELFDDTPKKLIKNLRTGEIYETKEQASASVGVGVNHVSKLLSHRLSRNSDYFLVYD